MKCLFRFRRPIGTTKLLVIVFASLSIRFDWCFVLVQLEPFSPSFSLFVRIFFGIESNTENFTLCSVCGPSNNPTQINVSSVPCFVSVCESSTIENRHAAIDHYCLWIFKMTKCRRDTNRIIKTQKRWKAALVNEFDHGSVSFRFISMKITWLFSRKKSEKKHSKNITDSKPCQKRFIFVSRINFHIYFDSFIFSMWKFAL